MKAYAENTSLDYRYYLSTYEREIGKVKSRSRREHSRIAKRRRGSQKPERGVRTLLLVFRSSSSALGAIPRRVRPMATVALCRIPLCWIWRDVYPTHPPFPFFLPRSVSLFFAYRRANDEAIMRAREGGDAWNARGWPKSVLRLRDTRASG